MEKRCLTKKILLISLVLLIIPFTSAFSGLGAGTEADPYQIINCSALQEVSDNLTANYILTNDIDCSDTVNWNGGLGFNPIGNGSQFEGEFDGQDYTISDLNITRNATVTTIGALFETINESGYVHNFYLTDFRIRADSQAASVAVNNYGTISNITSYGVVLASNNPGGNANAGGIVIFNIGNISNTRFVGNVTGLCYGTNCQSNTAGFVVSNVGWTVADGWLNQLIFNCSSDVIAYGLGGGTATLATERANVAGFVATNTGGNINNSYSDGTLQSACTGSGSDGSTLGGFVATSTGKIFNSYSHANSTNGCSGNLYTGGFIGSISSGRVMNCFSTGTVTGGTTGGFLASTPNGAWKNNFWDVNTSGIPSGSAFANPLTTTEMQDVRSFTDTTFNSDLVLSVWDFVGNEYNDTLNNDYWDIDPYINHGYPYLLGFPSIVDLPSITLSYPVDNITLSLTNFTFNGTVTRNGHDINNVTLFVSSFTQIDKYYSDFLYAGSNFTTNSTDPVGIAMNETFFWIGDYDEAKIKKYYLNGTYTGDFFNTASGNNLPAGIETNGTNIWVTDYFETGVIFEYDMEGNFIRNQSTFVANLYPRGMTFNGTFLWTVDEVTDNIYKYSIDPFFGNLTYVSTFAGPSNAFGITHDDNYLWVINNETAYKYSIDGTSVSSKDFVVRPDAPTFARGITNNGTFFWIPFYQDNVYKYYKFQEQNDTIDFSFIQELETDGSYNWKIGIYFDDETYLESETRTVTRDTEFGPVCGDGTCEGDENWANCPQDCPRPPPIPPYCGDGSCNDDETNVHGYGGVYCIEDCGYPPILTFDSENATIFYEFIDPNLEMCWWSNDSGITNNTIDCTSGVEFNFTIIEEVSGDYYDNAFLWANDTFANLKTVAIRYRVSLDAPSVNSIYPNNNQYLDSSTIFLNVTATDVDGIERCSLWTNETGTWSLAQSNTTPVSSGVVYPFIETFLDGIYSYAFECTDIYSTSAFSADNRTFIVDTEVPVATIHRVSTFAGNLSMVFNSSEIDANLFACSYTVTYVNGTIDAGNNGTVYPCGIYQNHTTAEVPDYREYLIKTYVRDRAGNIINSNTMLFEVSETEGGVTEYTPGGGGGGGGGATIEELEQELDLRGFCGDGICQDGSNNTFNRGEDFFTCPNDCSGIQAISFQNINLETLLLNCVSNDEELREKCIWRTQPGLLVIVVIIVLFFLFTIFFSYERKSKNKILKKIKYNPDFINKLKKQQRRR